MAGTSTVVASVSGDVIRTVLDAAQEAYISIDERGTVTEWNRAAADTFGWSREQVIGQHLADLIIPDRMREAHRRGLARHLATGAGRVVGQRLELPAVRRDGTEIPVEMTISAFGIEGRQHFSAFLHDISARRAAERDTRRLATIIASTQDAVISGSIDGTIETWNRGAERLYGYGAEEMIGTSVARLRPEGSLDDVTGVNDRLRRGFAVSMETRERRADGTLVDVEVTMSPLRDDAGTVVGVSSIVRDVSARKRTDAKLREAQSRFSGAFGSAAIGMAIVDLDGGFIAVNPALCRLLGRTESGLLCTSFQAITHAEDLDADLDLLHSLLAGEIEDYTLDKRYLLPDGGVVWAQLSVSLVRDGSGEPLHFVSQVQDITERKTAEAELRRYAAELARLDAAAKPDEAELLAALGASPDARLTMFKAPGLPTDRVIATLSGAARATDLVVPMDDGEVALLVHPAPGPNSESAERRLGSMLADLDAWAEWSAGRPVRRRDDESPAEMVGRARESFVPLARPRPALSARIERVLALAREQLGVDMTFLAELSGGEMRVHAVGGDAESFGLPAGTRVPAAETYCRRMVDGDIPHAVPDSASEPAVASLQITATADIGAYAGVPVGRADGSVYGTLCALSHEAQALGDREVRLLHFLAGVVTEEICEHERTAARRAEHVELAGMRALLGALEARDFYTSEHSREVVAMAREVGLRLGLGGADLVEVEHVALLHDIGKVGIPDAILQKQGRLSELEWELMRQHPVVGERIVAGTTGLEHLAPAVRAEHERWDGGGYPDGLVGDAIPLAARIGFVCDAYHAMTSDRPYREALPEADARAELRRCAGTQFDPTVVAALLAVLGDARQ